MYTRDSEWYLPRATHSYNLCKLRVVDSLALLQGREASAVDAAHIAAVAKQQVCVRRVSRRAQVGECRTSYQPLQGVESGLQKTAESPTASSVRRGLRLDAAARAHSLRFRACMPVRDGARTRVDKEQERSTAAKERKTHCSIRKGNGVE